MNEHQARELERILSGRPAYKRVTVTPQETGAHIVIEHCAAGRGVFTIRDGPSALLNYLLPVTQD